MKKVLFIALALVLCLCMGSACLAQEQALTLQEEQAEAQDGVGEGSALPNETADVKAYIMDKIVPIAVAVLTSALAFLTTLGTIARSLKALKDTKEAFSDEAKERAVFFECGMEMLNEKAEELKELVADVPRLKEEMTELAQECRLNSEILALGFSANSEVIKSGKGKKMSILLDNAKGKKIPNTTTRNPTPTKERSEDPDERVGGTEKEVKANETI